MLAVISWRLLDACCYFVEGPGCLLFLPGDFGITCCYFMQHGIAQMWQFYMKKEVNSANRTVKCKSSSLRYSIHTYTHIRCNLVCPSMSFQQQHIGH